MCRLTHVSGELVNEHVQGPWLGNVLMGWGMWWPSYGAGVKSETVLSLEATCYLLSFRECIKGFQDPLRESHLPTLSCRGAVWSILLPLRASSCASILWRGFCCYWARSCGWGQCCLPPPLTSLAGVVANDGAVPWAWSWLNNLSAQFKLCFTHKGDYICLDILGPRQLWWAVANQKFFWIVGQQYCCVLIVLCCHGWKCFGWRAGRLLACVGLSVVCSIVADIEHIGFLMGYLTEWMLVTDLEQKIKQFCIATTSHYVWWAFKYPCTTNVYNLLSTPFLLVPPITEQLGTF